MALAEFLAPAIILSADSVFTRLGYSNTDATTWVNTAYMMLQAAGFEANLADAAMLAEGAARLLVIGGAAITRLARRNPAPVLVLLAGGLYLIERAGYLDFGRLRDGARRLIDAARPWVEEFADAMSEHQHARMALQAVEPYGSPTLEQSAARYLARCGRPLTAEELRDILTSKGHPVSATRLKRAMEAHPGFLKDPDDRYTIGQPAGR
ncbi:hypothetical protein [Microbispora sp. H10830]|uniref:hypothetical protein n=1 Tax=Microbispora sp. H10830 TaxID=2729109 RepID=UPI001600659B|nr:hypothetical protein [Microbispora sp. H10830]